MKKKEGGFLSCEDGRQFFEFARQKVDKIKISGPTLGYVQSLKHFDIVFKKNVQIDFLNNQKQILHFVPLQRTKLSAIKINQFLNQYSSYQNEDSYIFLSSEGLLRLQSGVLNAFKAENTGNLLIIECKNQINDIQKLYSDLKSIIDNNSNKKIILIAEDGNILAHLFKIDYQKENDEPINDLSDLTLQLGIPLRIFVLASWLKMRKIKMVAEGSLNSDLILSYLSGTTEGQTHGMMFGANEVRCT